jgi:predicted Zn-dependent protease
VRPPPIHLIPLTPWQLPAELPERVRAGLEELLELEVRLGEPVALEELLGGRAELRISSNDVVDSLALREGADAGTIRPWVVALTDRELFASGRGAVFGEAALGGRWAVVSAARLIDASGGEQTLERLLKECAHELGHLAGLGHCSRAPCSMRASATPTDVDRKEARFCPECEERFRDGSRS